MQVLKFGGSSVANATRISAMMDIVHEALKKDRVLLVCSAISGCTDYLLNNEDFKPLCEKHIAIIDRLFTGSQHEEAVDEIYDYFDALKLVPKEERVTFGELLSTLIISRRFACEGVDTYWIDSRKVIKVNAENKVETELTYREIRETVEENDQFPLFVAPGFIASTLDGKVTTLGRGGSDYSAALYAAALRASELQIWTDVPGIMSANPKVIPSARTTAMMGYDAAFTLAENGAKVLYAPTVQPARDAGIAISIRNTFDPGDAGTLISDNGNLKQWCAVTSLRCGDSVRICLVGENVDSRSESSNRIVNALNNNGISPLTKVYGEGSVFFVDVALRVEKEALEAIHTEFFVHSSPTTINLYIAGNGAVGKALVSLLETGTDRIFKRTGKLLRIAGQSDSRHYVMGGESCPVGKGSLNTVIASDRVAISFVDAVAAVAPQNSVFVDCTNSEDLYTEYEKLFRKGISVVTSNRRSLAIPYTKYAALHRIARENACFFRYDTTVGTSLPILESIASSANCSDEIESVEAVVSCTLNNLFTSYTGREKSFAQLLRESQDSGLTEKDPRTDLGGRDVLRKLLIIAREAGVSLEESDVEISPILPAELFDCDLEEFYHKLAALEPSFVSLTNSLSDSGLRQRFVASLIKDSNSRLGYKAEIKMQNVGIDSPFYWINGTENVIIIRSSHSAPLVIKGAGEGAKQAAIGIVKDILS